MANNYNKETKQIYAEINECTSSGACSISPTIASLQELSIAFLQQISHYVLLLEALGAKNSKITLEIVTVLASLVSANEFSDNQIFSIIKNEYYLLKNVKETYLKTCKQQNITPHRLKTNIHFSENSTLPQAIILGEKIFLEKYKKFNYEEKNLIIILEMILKSVSLNIIKSTDFDIDEYENINNVMKSLDIFNHKKLSAKKITEEISKLAQIDNKIQIKLSRKLMNYFGGISETKVSHSTQKGKAILVSGNNFSDLLHLLKQTEGKDIDIYTHSNLLISHAFKNFQAFKHFKGHFGDKTENCLIDFATFPGAILLTKNSINNTEYFYRGRLFSTDYIVPKGVIPITNRNFDELITAAINAKGFTKGKVKEDTIIGFDEQIISKKLSDISKKLNNNKIKHLYIIGIDAHLELQKEYFNDFFNNLKTDEFAISFSYSSQKENVLTIPIGNFIPLATHILMKLFDKTLIGSENITFFLTTCDVMSISSIVTLKNLNAKSLYMAKCPPTLINPSVYKTLSKYYNILTTTNAKKDLESIRKIRGTE